METSQVLLVVGLLINSVGLGGIFKWLFTNEHERRNLVNDAVYVKNKLSEVKQRLENVEKQVNNQATDHKILDKEISYIKITLDEIKKMLEKISK